MQRLPKVDDNDGGNLNVAVQRVKVGGKVDVKGVNLNLPVARSLPVPISLDPSIDAS